MNARALWILGAVGLVFAGFVFGFAVAEITRYDWKTNVSQQEEAKKGEAKAPEKKEEKKGEPVEVSGDGNQVTEPFNLSGGLATFKTSYQNQRQLSSLFQIKLIDRDGNFVPGGLVANEIVQEGDTVQPSKGVRVSAGEHWLNVQADGPWTVTIEQ